MPIEAPFGQAYLFITVPMPLLSRRARGKNERHGRMFSWFCALCSREYRMV